MILYERENKESGKEYAYRVLKKNIMSLELKPGESIKENELSELLGISRTPIREILMRLKGEHLIDVKPQSGTYISLIDLDLVENAIFMRSLIEKEIINIACKEIDESVLVELDKNLFAQEIIASMEGGEVEFHNLDTHFHELIFKGVGKQYVWDSVVNISTHYNRLRLLTQTKDPKFVVVNQHKEILQAIKNKTSDSAINLIGNHIEYFKQSWDYFIKSNEEISSYFKL